MKNHDEILSTEINRVYNRVFSDRSNRNKVFPLSLFKRDFLEFFKTNKDDIAETNEGEISKRVMWITIAGSPYAPVDIIDDYTHEVITTIPPLLNSDFINHGDINKIGVMGMEIDRGRLLSNRIPGGGDKVIANSANAIIQNNKPTESPSMNLALALAKVDEGVNQFINGLKKENNPSEKINRVEDDFLDLDDD